MALDPPSPPRSFSYFLSQKRTDMKTQWAIEENIFPKEYDQELCDVITELGMEVIHTNLEDDIDNECIPYGSVPFISDLDGYGSFESVYFNKTALSWGTLSKHWSNYLLNDKHIVTTLECFKNKLNFFYENFGREELVFIKPFLSDKSFNAQLFNRVAAYDTLSMMSKRMGLHDQTLIVVAEPKVLNNEWRFFIADRKVIASSQYNKNRAPHKEEGCHSKAVLELLDCVLKDEWQPLRAYVVDLCESEGKPYVIEIGCVNCSDLYASDKKSFVQGLSKL